MRTFDISRNFVCAVIAVMAIGGTATLAFAIGPYTITAIETLGGDRNFANDISDTGFVTGNSRKAGGTQLFPYVWQAGVVEEIPILPDVPTFGRGFGVNDSGVVAGESGNGPSKAFRYDSATDTIFDLGTLPGANGAVANDINSDGRVVGVSGGRAFITSNTGGLIDLGTPLGTSDSSARAYAVSENGIVAGNARNMADTTSEPTLWLPDGSGSYTPMTIGTPAGSVFGEALAATDDGRAVGRYSDPVSGQTRAFFYDGSTSVDLGLLTGETFDNARALDLNDAGQIVGYVADFDNAPSFGGAAVLWESGNLFDLNSLVLAGNGWNLLSAQAINNEGQIVGFGTFGGDTRAFLLTPVPEPAALSLATLSAIGASILRRRRR